MRCVRKEKGRACGEKGVRTRNGNRDSVREKKRRVCDAGLEEKYAVRESERA